MLVNSRKKIFGRSSEKSKFFDDAQLTLFNEAETIAEPSTPEPEKETFIAAHKRRKKRTKAEITENLQHIKQVCDMEKLNARSAAVSLPALVRNLSAVN